MSYKNKIYVAFHYGDPFSINNGESKYYHLMQAWKESLDFSFHDAHEINNIKKTSSKETISANLQERLRNTKIMLVLIGNETKNREWVNWEINQAIKRDIPIIAIETDKNTKLPSSSRLPLNLLMHKFGFCNFEEMKIKSAIAKWPGKSKEIETGYYINYNY